ncbi:DM13 domain-containing protein [Actinomyces sp.]|uniref:DM13 domain-containing protein n=1 Tax=Actinomyces sp. TaxID=29317 RepID=UPI0026DB2CCA|nr:DM13 domain-containing protein [Actinomyces sp.]MDO4899116.1 DM13 domain-containing protein [Actinomyces sp.]
MSLAFPHSKRVILPLAGITAILLIAALAIFKPWLLFIDKTVNDALPPAAATAPDTPQSDAPDPGLQTQSQPAAPTVVATGSFVSHEHETSGTATIYRLPDGSHQLALADLMTSNGPDVHVWLSAGPVVEGTGGWHTAADHDHLDVSTLKGNKGNQLYDLPSDIDLTTWKSVVLWCEDFSVSFGAAALTASA